MGVTYLPATEDAAGFIAGVMEKFHPHLHDAGVLLTTVFALAPRDEQGKRTGPAIRLHGYTCAATIKPTQLKRRVQGLGDAELTIDGDSWSDYSVKQRTALIDHQLSHLILVEDQDGRVVLDAINRPKLKSRLHDWQLGGFEHVLKRHGEHSLESHHLIDPSGQYLFEWTVNYAAAHSAPRTDRRRRGTPATALQEQPA